VGSETSTNGGKGGSCFLACLPLKSLIISNAHKNYDSPEAGGDQQASKYGQPVDCKWLKRMEPEWNERC